MSRLEPSWAPVPPPASQPLGTLPLEIRNGACLIGSDCHWVPNQPPSTATRAFVKMARQLSDQGELQSLILAGDLADFPKISRHPRIMWEPQPSVADELREVRARMEEIAEAAGPDVPLTMLVGNHEQRFSSFLSQAVPQCEGIPGFGLGDQIDPRWEMGWQAEINGSGPEGVLVRHRLKGGSGAGRSNVLAAGRSVITGHTHQLNVTRVSNSLGHFWGVDLGTMSPIGSGAFTGYTEMAAASGMAGWASGFAVLTFVEGRLIWPELVHVVEEAAGLYTFRGRLFNVDQPMVLN